MPSMTEDEILKMNAIHIIKHHIKTCTVSSCTMSMMLLCILLRRAGIELTDEEQSMFL